MSASRDRRRGAGSRPSSGSHDVTLGARRRRPDAVVRPRASTETSGREVFTIALTAQINIDPARRSYDAETRAALVELFGRARALGGDHARASCGRRSSTLVPSFTGETTFTLPVPCTYDLELAAAKYLYSAARRRGAAELPLHRLGAATAATTAQLQVVLIPWTCSADWRMPVATWREMMEHHYPNGAWVRLHADTLAALSRAGAPTGPAVLRRLRGRAAGGRVR